MKIGLLSDTHNHLPETRRALQQLLEHGARHLVHCGDAGEDVMDLMSATCLEHGIRAHVALGNCDCRQGEDPPFQPCPAGLEIGPAPEFHLAGKHCIAMHGDRAKRLEEVTASGKFDYVFTGHTHAASDRRMGKTRVLNPGSAARPRRGAPKVALLDLDTDTVMWLGV